MSKMILAINAGSSSLKFSLHPIENNKAQKDIFNGNIQGLEPNGKPEIVWKFNGEKNQENLDLANYKIPFDGAIAYLNNLLKKLNFENDILAVSHRVVHGGGVFNKSVLVDDKILEQLESFNSLAPLHQPHNVNGIKSFKDFFKNLPQIACFDTAFHSTIPAVAYDLAFPKKLKDLGLRRYGFHGLSYQYVIGQLLEKSSLAKERVIMAHLGNGASLCATKEAKSIETSMGFSALDGLMMGTRPGNLDSGVLLYLLEQGWKHKEIEKLLYKESGLLGVSGISADMRTLGESNLEEAKKAISQFIYKLNSKIGGFIACLKGLDVLAFSGGIGENDDLVRLEVCRNLSWIGLKLDENLNNIRSSETRKISTSDSKIEVWIIPTDEGIVLAQDSLSLI